MDIVLITDDAEGESVLPMLRMVARTVRYAALTRLVDIDHWHGIDVAVVDARTDLPAARRICRQLTAAAPSVAKVAVVSPEDVVAVDLEWHLDDMVLASVGTAELQTRLRLANARRRKTVDSTIQFGDLMLHPASYTASLPDRELDLTLTEFKLLSHLVRNAGRAFTRTRLMQEVWGHQCSRRTVDVHVQRLRAKLGADYESIVDTVRGVGYMAAGVPPVIAAEPAPIIMAQ